MFALTSQHANEHLQEYCQKVQLHISKNPQTHFYAVDNVVKGGLTTYLHSRYYPHYKRKKKRRSRKRVVANKASSRKEGIAIMLQLFSFVKEGKKPKNAMAAAIVEFFSRLDHSLQAVELPVHITNIDRVTQADLITEDTAGRLWMWEIKAGYNRVQKQGNMAKPYDGVPNREHEHWELQRYFTHQGLVEAGLKLYQSRVLNVYRDDQHQIHVVPRQIPNWIK
jgi:hypothetical protein